MKLLGRPRRQGTFNTTSKRQKVSSQDVRLGIVGAGRVFVDTHLTNFCAIPGVCVSGVANRAPESARRVASMLPASRAFEDWRELVASPDVDAVAVGGPPNLQCVVVRLALENGKHVFCQFPGGTTSYEIDSVAEHAAARPDQVAVISSSPQRARAPERVASLLTQVGRVTAVDVIHTTANAFGDVQFDWRPDPITTGAAMMGLAQFCDLIGSWLAPYSNVAVVTGYSEAVPGPTVIMVAGDLSGIPCVEYHASNSTLSRQHNLITIYGSDGTLRCNFEGGVVQFAHAGQDFVTVEHIRPSDRCEFDFIQAVRMAQRGESWRCCANNTLKIGARNLRVVEVLALSGHRRERLDTGLGPA